MKSLSGIKLKPLSIVKQIAFKKMVNNPKFKSWLKIKTARTLGTMKTPEQIEKDVDESMKEDNLKVEYFVPDNLHI